MDDFMLPARFGNQYFDASIADRQQRQRAGDVMPVLEKAAKDPDPGVANNAKAAIALLNAPATRP